MLRELGYSPALEQCAACGAAVAGLAQLAFSPSAGGVLCVACQARQRDRRPLSLAAWQALRMFSTSPEAWRQDWPAAVRKELRRLLGQYVTYLMGRQPRLLAYLGD
jgi:recombinational DNA repair protein (RecF pathway)